MAVPRKGSRRLVVGEWTLRYLIRYDRLHWSRGYASPVRLVVEDAQGGGQRLIAEFVGCRRDVDDPLREPFGPGFVRRVVAGGLARGWQPGSNGRPDVRLGQTEVEACARDAEPYLLPASQMKTND